MAISVRSRKNRPAATAHVVCFRLRRQSVSRVQQKRESSTRRQQDSELDIEIRRRRFKDSNRQLLIANSRKSPRAPLSLSPNNAEATMSSLRPATVIATLFQLLGGSLSSPA